MIAKLEGVNDKLNHDIARLKEERSELKSQKEEDMRINEDLKQQVNSMKEELFACEHERQQNKLLKRQLELASAKMGNKMDRIKKA